MKAIVVDKDYGSVTSAELSRIQSAYAKANIELEQCHFRTEEELIAGCRGAIALLCTGNPPISRRVMQALPELRFIQRFGVGVNSIDLDAATELGKLVLFLPGFCARELADMATAMILGLIRNTAYYDRQLRAGGWPKCQYLLPPDVRTMTLGLYGFGSAARCLHDIFSGGFGSRVIACDPYVSQQVRTQYPEVEFVSFDALLEQSDILSIHVGLTAQTTHVFDRAAFSRMKNSAMLINTARGPIVDQEALVWALENGEIRYAGLDTFEQEPIAADDPLLKMDNVLLSPHSGSYGAGAKQTQIDMVCQLVPGALTSGRMPAACVANRVLPGQDIGCELI